MNDPKEKYQDIQCCTTKRYLGTTLFSEKPKTQKYVQFCSKENTLKSNQRTVILN